MNQTLISCRRPRRSSAAPARAALLLAVLTACLALPRAASAQIRVLSADTDTKPADPVVAPFRTTFDCSGRDTFAVAAGFAVTLADTTTDGVNLIDSYPSCALWNEHGPEHIYRLDVAEPVELWAGLSDLGGVDLDLFLLNDCDSEACVVGANTEFTALLEPGLYFVVVDGYGSSNPAAGAYTLDLQARQQGVPLAVCEEGGAEPLACAGAIIQREGDLYGRPNLIQSYDCTTSLLRGGEWWYRVELPGVHQVQVQVSPSAQALDPAIWVFDGCGPTAACLDFIDAKIGGQSETLLINNDAEEPLTVYVAVDAQRDVASEFDGFFGATFTCQSNVPTEKTSLGTLRAMYR